MGISDCYNSIFDENIVGLSFYLNDTFFCTAQKTRVLGKLQVKKVASPKRMNFRKSFKQPLTPPPFSENCIAIFSENVEKEPYFQSKICNINFWIENDRLPPTPLELFENSSILVLPSVPQIFAQMGPLGLSSLCLSLCPLQKSIYVINNPRLLAMNYKIGKRYTILSHLAEIVNLLL